MIFGDCQNHQNQTFKRPYQPEKSWFKKYFYAKINTTLSLHLSQNAIFLPGHLHFFFAFFLHIYGEPFWKTPYICLLRQIRKKNVIISIIYCFVNVSRNVLADQLMYLSLVIRSEKECISNIFSLVSKIGMTMYRVFHATIDKKKRHIWLWPLSAAVVAVETSMTNLLLAK